jgi:hypothetical protein
VFKPDPGVVPDDEICEKAGITVVNTGAQHTDMSDRGPETLKTKIQGLLDKFLDDDSKLSPVTGKPKIIEQSAQQSSATDPNKIAQYTPSVN